MIHDENCICHLCLPGNPETGIMNKGQDSGDVINSLADDVDSLQSKLKAATELLEKMKPFLRHAKGCEIPSLKAVSKCICGLDDLRKQIDAIGK